MLQNNIPMQTKPISFSPKRYIFCIQKSLISSSKDISFIFEIRDFQISNFLRFPQEIDNHPDLFRCQFSLSIAEPGSF